MSILPESDEKIPGCGHGRRLKSGGKVGWHGGKARSPGSLVNQGQDRRNHRIGKGGLSTKLILARPKFGVLVERLRSQIWSLSLGGSPPACGIRDILVTLGKSSPIPHQRELHGGHLGRRHSKTPLDVASLIGGLFWYPGEMEDCAPARGGSPEIRGECDAKNFVPGPHVPLLYMPFCMAGDYRLKNSYRSLLHSVYVILIL